MIKERTEKILSSTIESYIESGEVLGSHALLKKYRWDCSSATVRNDLKQLKDLGYLTQSHISSGSVPTAKGYSHYLKGLTENTIEQTNPMDQFQIQMTRVSQDLDSVLTGMGQFISKSLNYTVLLSVPGFWMHQIKTLHVIAVNMNSILLLVLNSMGVSQDILLSFKHDYSQDELNQFSKALTEYLEGKTVSEFSQVDLLNLYQLLPKYRRIIEELFDRIKTHSSNTELSKLNHFGVSNMLRLPECNDFDSN